MTKLLMICLSSLLAGCATLDTPPHDTVLYSYSAKFNKCRKFKFLISKDAVGRVGRAENVPLKECDNITGPKNKSEEHNDWSDFRAWLENLFDIAKDEIQDFNEPQTNFNFASKDEN